MGKNLFEGLPPPSSFAFESADPQNQDQASKIALEEKKSKQKESKARETSPLHAPALVPALKSALKRSSSNPTETQSEDGAPEKKLKFKMTTDASEMQVIEAMQKIASHIKNPTKFRKASKLAIQLIQAGSVKPETSDYFFSILEAAMSLPTVCTDASVRADYHALFTASQDAAEYFNKKQKNQLTTWIIRAVTANDLFTDDSFVFSKATGRIKEAISSLPIATEADDIEEASTLKDEPGHDKKKCANSAEASVGSPGKEETDPFGLDALISSTHSKEEKRVENKKAVAKEEEEEETKRFLKAQREALVTCLEIAARRYKAPWCQTAIDILVKSAFDNVARFTSQQRDAIRKLWASIKEQQTRRKQGRSASGKLDVNAFEGLQRKYANEKISIRHAVGGSGDRRCEQWLG